ncbi:hypothetical protein [Streptomyces sp. T028]|uniref:hypothetical protein n=1 Tax=Streptomyces sp. T028 TaxID=3394379 RepID=UPI003A83AEC4
MATEDRDRSRREWQEDGKALLRCGGVSGAVRVRADLVHAAAGTDEPAAVGHYLRRALLGSAVFADLTNQQHYVLVGNTTGLREEWERPRDDAEFMGRGHFLGVPPAGATSADSRCYWAVEMESLGVLADPNAVSQLVRDGRKAVHRERPLSG